MGLIQVNREQVIEATIRSLGFNNTSVNLEVPEVLAESIRRAASFQCPVTPMDLVRSIEEAFSGLTSVANTNKSNSIVRTMIENLVAYGDLVEAPITEEETRILRRFLFLGHPSYVPLPDDNICLLVGVRARNYSVSDESISSRLYYDNYKRCIKFQKNEKPKDILGSLGYRELSLEQWLKCPLEEAPSAIIKKYDTYLDQADQSGLVGPVEIIDPKSPVIYYPGRWRGTIPKDTGRFVGRRPVEFGAAQWCYFDIVGGEVSKLVDLPVIDQLVRGCDEAWHLQAAIDAVRETPQLLRVDHNSPKGQVIFQFKSPVPSWVQRWLDKLGQPLGHQKGCLFAYRFPEKRLNIVLEILCKNMWLEIEV